jgi:transcriptional regulator with XRE-family HTH domain
MDYLDSFGDWLRQRREAFRLTRPELADCAGCSVSALRKIKADERRPLRQVAELLAGCYPS